eukprot:317696-Prymnesium_polylepis.2
MCIRDSCHPGPVHVAAPGHAIRAEALAALNLGANHPPHNRACAATHAARTHHAHAPRGPHARPSSPARVRAHQPPLTRQRTRSRLVWPCGGVWAAPTG